VNPTYEGATNGTARSGVRTPDAWAWVVADCVATGALLVLIVVALLWPDLGGVKEKASVGRAVAYPLGAFAVPALWVLVWRRQGRPFPWLGDTLVTLPWLADTLGNRLDLFDTVVWWDDWMHFGNWALLTAGVLVLTTDRRTGAPATFERALAFGITAALLWEVAEYWTFIRFSPELATAYTDTLGDMSLGTLGSLVAATVTVLVRPRSRAAG
jgi:hypothetical protein